MANQTPQVADSVHLASELGRLDFASLLLAIVALIIGIMALPVFRYLVYRAELSAKEEVRELTQGIHEAVEREAISKIEEMLPILMDEYREVVQNSVTGDLADDIAEAQEDGTK